jgi:hypothetical protein
MDAPVSAGQSAFQRRLEQHRGATLTPTPLPPAGEGLLSRWRASDNILERMRQREL